MLTSMIKRVDEAVFQTIADVIAGEFVPEEKMYGLADGGVGVSEMLFTRDVIGNDKIEQLDYIRNDIISGVIKVPKNEKEWHAMLELDRSRS